MQRMVLFLLTNIAIVLLLSITASLLGVNRFLHAGGLNLAQLLGFALIFGFGGSLISLLLSKPIALWSTGAQVIEQPHDRTQQWLLQVVERQAQRAGIGMPQVAIYDAPDVNAFATGASRNHALVAVSSGLLQRMTAEEAEAVLGHEISHIANGDMVTMTLLQGVVNTFVIFMARVVAFAVDRAVAGSNSHRGPGFAYYIVSSIAELLFGLLASMIVMWFSRQREFRADAGGADLAGRSKMIAALIRLQNLHQPSSLPTQMAAFGINSGLPQGWRKLFMSHPPLEERIEALRQGQR